ncbi:hypothetical protein BDZ45DRAFT_799163 [Acephala macrosclerotiorum]|nr:hypothetical protein BDZ45DRAFT_799163 [Acephala macrosclerotiorum]
MPDAWPCQYAHLVMQRASINGKFAWERILDVYAGHGDASQGVKSECLALAPRDGPDACYKEEREYPTDCDSNGILSLKKKQTESHRSTGPPEDQPRPSPPAHQPTSSPAHPSQPPSKRITTDYHSALTQTKRASHVYMVVPTIGAVDEDESYEEFHVLYASLEDANSRVYDLRLDYEAEYPTLTEYSADVSGGVLSWIIPIGGLEQNGIHVVVREEYIWPKVLEKKRNWMRALEPTDLDLDEYSWSSSSGF